jgi:hypothetical protein
VSNEFKDVLRERVEGLLRARLDAVDSAVAEFRTEVDAAFERVRDASSAASKVSLDGQELLPITAEITAQIGQAAAESSRLSGDLALLRDSVVDIDSQQTQADVLNALVSRAASFAPRVVLFVVKGEAAIAWAARGFDDEIGDAAVRGLSVALGADTLLGAVLSAGKTFLGEPGERRDNAVLLDRLGSTSPERIAGIPLRVRGKTVGILYADSYDTSVGSISIEALELLVHSAGIIVELASLRQRIAEPSGRLVAPPGAPAGEIGGAAAAGEDGDAGVEEAAAPDVASDVEPAEDATAEATESAPTPEPLAEPEDAGDAFAIESAPDESVRDEAAPETGAEEDDATALYGAEIAPTGFDAVAHDEAAELAAVENSGVGLPPTAEAPIGSAPIAPESEPSDDFEVVESASAEEPEAYVEIELPPVEPEGWAEPEPVSDEAPFTIGAGEPDYFGSVQAEESAPFSIDEVAAEASEPAAEVLETEPETIASSAPAEALDDDEMPTEQWSGAPLEPATHPRSAPPEAGELSPEEEKMHSDARRFARLLVSEIKLYNEQQVSEGRQQNDLYDRLKDDIDRSRQMYDKRVAAQVADRFDYFYDELVNTLGEGEPGKLGPDCPGPTV